MYVQTQITVRSSQHIIQCNTIAVLYQQLYLVIRMVIALVVIALVIAYSSALTKVKSCSPLTKVFLANINEMIADIL